MLLDPTPSFMRSRSQHLDLWIAEINGNKVPEGFSSTLAKVAMEEGANWPWLAAVACDRSWYFERSVAAYTYFTNTGATSLESAIREAMKIGKANGTDFNYNKVQSIYSQFVLWSAKRVGKESADKSGTVITPVPVEGPKDPYKPGEAPKTPVVPQPISVPKPTPDPVAAPVKVPFQVPWYVKIFKGTIITAAVAAITWLLSFVPFLAPFHALIVGAVTKIIEYILS